MPSYASQYSRKRREPVRTGFFPYRSHFPPDGERKICNPNLTISARPNHHRIRDPEQQNRPDHDTSAPPAIPSKHFLSGPIRRN
jgi:hypothetical protein